MADETLTPEQAEAIWNEEAAKLDKPEANDPVVAKESEQVTEVATETETPPKQAEEPKQEEKQEKVEETPPQDPVIAELRAKLEKLEGRQRNVEGHIGGIKQQLTDTLTVAQAAAKATPNAPTASQVAEAIKDPDEWQELKDEFPQWATATEKLLESRLKSVAAPAFDPSQLQAEVDQRIQGLTQSMRQEIIDQTLEAQFPGWKDEVRSEKFSAWLQAQPDEVKTLAESPSVGDAARMLKLFDQAKQADPSERIEAQRKQTLAAAASAPRQGVRSVPKQKTPDQMTPEELWNYEAAKREQERRERGY